MTTLVPPATPEAVRVDARQRTTKVPTAFRQHLARAGLSPYLMPPLQAPMHYRVGSESCAVLSQPRTRMASTVTGLDRR